MQRRRVTIHGHEVAFRMAGEGPVLLLVHGMAGSSTTWRHVMPALATRFTVLAPDLLGHGESAKPHGEYSLGAHTNLLRDLLNALDIERATLVGQSLGGGVVMQMAYQFPERSERLVLVGSGGLGREVHLLLRALTVPGAEQALPFLWTEGLRDVASRVASWLGRAGMRAAPPVEEVWRSLASLADADSRRAFFRTLRAVVDPGGQAVSARDRLYLASQVPTLIVWGARDQFIPVEHAVATHEALPQSRLEIFEDVGHFPHCESPARFVEVLVDFVASTEPARLVERDLRALLAAGAVATRSASAPQAGDAARAPADVASERAPQPQVVEWAAPGIAPRPR